MSNLSYGILDVPIVGWALRQVQKTGINTDLNASPQWRQYGLPIIATAATIAGVVIFPPLLGALGVATGGTGIATATVAGTGVLTTIAGGITNSNIQTYYENNPNAKISDAISQGVISYSPYNTPVDVPASFSSKPVYIAVGLSGLIILTYILKKGVNKNE
jgi:hypothetical protein